MKPRPQGFFDADNIPSEDAPIDDLLDYWSVQTSQNRWLKSSLKSANRILDVLENEPDKLRSFLSILPNNPEIASRVKQISDKAQNNKDIDDYWRKGVRDWLKLNSKFYLDELIADAEKAKDHPKYFTVDKEEQLKALAKIDWQKAQPILQKLENDKNNPRTAVFAMKLSYEHFIEIKNKSNEEIYREKLKASLINQNLPGRARDIASDALFDSDWKGQDEYYLSVISDKSLFRLSDGGYGFRPLTTLPARNPDKWIPILAKLVGNENRAIHNVATLNLVQYKRKDALEPLIPWLSNPKWSDADERGYFMQYLDEVDLPESVPGLIWVIENDDWEARWAVDSLAHYKDPRAIPALKKRLEKEKNSDEFELFLKALVACGGLSVDEQMTAIEDYANRISTPAGFKEVVETYYHRDNPIPPQIRTGKFLANRKDVSEELVLQLTERQKVLQKEKPQVAKILSGIMAKWQGRLVNLELLERIKTGKADVETVVGALARLKDLQEKTNNEIKALQTENGLPKGIAVCLLEDENQLLQAFNTGDNETKISVLACARLLRLKLPVPEVAKYLHSDDKLLSLASERYLESEDSKEAQQYVLAKHPNEALILGARTSFNPNRLEKVPSTLGMLFSTVDNATQNGLRPDGTYFKSPDEAEDKLRDELKSNSDLVEIFALVPNYVVRIYKDKATMMWYENDARYRETALTNEQIKGLQEFWQTNNFDEVPPLFGSCHYNCASLNLIRINKNGGRRFFAYTNAGSLMPIFENFQSLGETEKTKTHYYSQNKVKDLQIIFADNRFSVKSVWKNGNDFRVLIEDVEKKEQIDDEIYKQNDADYKNDNLDWEQREKLAKQRRGKREFEHFEWRKFENGKLGEVVEQPKDIPFLRNESDVANENLFEYRTENEIWKVKGTKYEVYAGDNRKLGLWKVNRTQGETKLNNGWYGDAIITPDGKWAIAAKTDIDWSYPNYIVRVNVETGKENKINIPPANNLFPVSFIPELNKVLIYSSNEDYIFTSPPAKYYLFEAENGNVEEVKGEFRPLVQQSFRPLQKTKNQNEFWAAIPDGEKKETQIGRYNIKTFSFTNIKTIPDMAFNSMSMWVEEEEGRIYIVSGNYGQYQLISLLLK